MSQVGWEKRAIDGFIRNAIDKAEELSGLEFHLGTFQLEDTLNMEEEVAYFIPLENELCAGFFYLGFSKKDLDDFVEHVLFRLNSRGKKAKHQISKEQILIEYARDLYEIPDLENGTFNKIEQFFKEIEVNTDFVKFDGVVKQECLYFELENEDFGVVIKCKCMFYEKE